MDVTFSFGWWTSPFVVTFLSFFIAWFVTRNSEPGVYGAGALLTGIVYLVAAIASLIAWLVWAVLT